MEMIGMESSNVEAVGYDEDKKELHVRFKGGATYVYREVPIETYQKFMAAPSKGSFLATVIKPGFACSKMEIKK